MAGEGGPRAKPELNSASTLQQVAAPQSAHSSGGQAVQNLKKGARTRPHRAVRAKWRAQIKAVKLIVPLSAVTSLLGRQMCA